MVSIFQNLLLIRVKSDICSTFVSLQKWQLYVDTQPVKFFDRELLPHLVYVTRRMAKFIGMINDILLYNPITCSGFCQCLLLFCGIIPGMYYHFTNFRECYVNYAFTIIIIIIIMIIFYMYVFQVVILQILYWCLMLPQLLIPFCNRFLFLLGMK